MEITEHAFDRVKERSGLNHDAAIRIAQKALENGIAHSQCKGSLKRWVDKVYFTNKAANNIRLYGDKCYVFTGDRLITVLQIPAKLRNHMKDMVKS